MPSLTLPAPRAATRSADLGAAQGFSARSCLRARIPSSLKMWSFPRPRRARAQELFGKRLGRPRRFSHGRPAQRLHPAAPRQRRLCDLQPAVFSRRQRQKRRRRSAPDGAGGSILHAWRTCGAAGKPHSALWRALCPCSPRERLTDVLCTLRASGIEPSVFVFSPNPRTAPPRSCWSKESAVERAGLSLSRRLSPVLRSGIAFISANNEEWVVLSGDPIVLVY